MAREHHCPNCGPQACNASTSKIHTCGVCAAIWEEDLSVPVPAPAPTPAKPSAPAPVPTAKPATPPPAAPPVPKPVSTPPPVVAASAPAVPKAPVTAVPSTAPVPQPATPSARPPAPAPAPAAGPMAGRTLSSVVAAAKVKRCPKCVSDGLAAPLDFLETQGRMVLQDSQTYRGHLWYADTGEPYVRPAAVVPPAA